MITLNLLDHALGFLASFLSHIPVVANVIYTFSNLSNELSFYTNTEPLIQIFRLARLFLPTGTIVILFTLTSVLIAINLLTGLVYFLTHIGNII